MGLGEVLKMFEAKKKKKKQKKKKRFSIPSSALTFIDFGYCMTAQNMP